MVDSPSHQRQKLNQIYTIWQVKMKSASNLLSRHCIQRRLCKPTKEEPQQQTPEITNRNQM